MGAYVLNLQSFSLVPKLFNHDHYRGIFIGTYIHIDKLIQMLY